LGPDNKLDPAQISPFFKKLANGKPAKEGDLAHFLAAEIAQYATNPLVSAMAGAIADAAAKVAIIALDADGDGLFNEDDVRAFVEDILEQDRALAARA
jgi:hypothetical protein